MPTVLDRACEVQLDNHTSFRGYPHLCCGNRCEQLKAEERAAQRDDHQRQVLTDLLDALGDYIKAVGRELREMQDQGAISEEASAESFASGGRVERIAARVRNQDVRARVVAYRRFLLRLVLLYEPGTLLQTVNSIFAANREVLDAINLELGQCL